MIQRTIIYRTRPAGRAEMQRSEHAFPLTFLALAFGLIAGIALAGIVIPVVVQTVVPTLVRAVTGA
jgi:hypothetical protein